MKRILIILLAASFTLAMNSCQKCLRCSYTAPGGQPIEVGEQCGAEEDLTQLETECEDNAQAVGGTCECTGA